MPRTTRVYEGVLDTDTPRDNEPVVITWDDVHRATRNFAALITQDEHYSSEEQQSLIQTYKELLSDDLPPYSNVLNESVFGSWTKGYCETCGSGVGLCVGMNNRARSKLITEIVVCDLCVARAMKIERGLKRGYIQCRCGFEVDADRVLEQEGLCAQCYRTKVTNRLQTH